MKRLVTLVIILAAFFFLLPSQTKPASAACTWKVSTQQCTGTCSDSNCGTCTETSEGVCGCINAPAAYCDLSLCECGKCSKSSCGGTCTGTCCTCGGEG